MAEKKSAEKTVDAPLTYDELKNMPDSEKPVSDKVRRTPIMMNAAGETANPLYQKVDLGRDQNNAHRLDLLDTAQADAIRAIEEIPKPYLDSMDRLIDPKADFKQDTAAVVDIMKESVKGRKGCGFLQKSPRTAPEGYAKMVKSPSPQLKSIHDPQSCRRVYLGAMRKLMDFENQYEKNADPEVLKKSPTITADGKTVHLMDLGAKKADGTPVFDTQQTMQILKINAVMVTAGKLVHDYSVARKEPGLDEAIANADKAIRVATDRFNAVREATDKKRAQLEARGFVPAEQTQDVDFIKPRGAKAVKGHEVIYAAAFGEPTIGTEKDKGPRDFDGLVNAMRAYGQEHVEVKSAGPRPRKVQQVEAVEEVQAPAPKEATVEATPVETEPVSVVAEVAVAEQPTAPVSAYEEDIAAVAASVDEQEKQSEFSDDQLPF